MSRAQVLELYRNSLRAARSLTNYNFRSYALRRLREEYRAAKHLSSAEAGRQYTWGVEQFQVIYRQAVVSSLYPALPSAVQTH
jgi:hypothetical protein